MIKETKRKVMREVEITTSTEYLCDLCKEEIMDRSFFSRDSFRVKLTRGEVFPEGGSTVTEQAHFCEKCAGTIKTTLESIGVVFETVEKDY